jgi:hypothetical protein
MCLSLFLASNSDLPPLELEELTVEELLPRRRRHRRELEVLRTSLGGLPHVYRVSSHSGCGCGFIREPRDATEDAESLRSLTALREYVEAASSVSDVELLFTWFGYRDDTPVECSVEPTGLIELDLERTADRPLRVTIERC